VERIVPEFLHRGTGGTGKAARPAARAVRRLRQRFVLARASLLLLPIKALQLLLALLSCALLLDLRLGAARSLVIRWQRRLNVHVLPVMQLLLPLPLVDLQLADRLLLAWIGGRRLDAALILLHAKLKFVLLLLPQLLDALQLALGRVVAPRRSRQRQFREDDEDPPFPAIVAKTHRPHAAFTDGSPASAIASSASS